MVGTFGPSIGKETKLIKQLQTFKVSIFKPFPNWSRTRRVRGYLLTYYSIDSSGPSVPRLCSALRASLQYWKEQTKHQTCKFWRFELFHWCEDRRSEPIEDPKGPRNTYLLTYYSIILYWIGNRRFPINPMDARNLWFRASIPSNQKHQSLLHPKAVFSLQNDPL